MSDPMGAWPGPINIAMGYFVMSIVIGPLECNQSTIHTLVLIAQKAIGNCKSYTINTMISRFYTGVTILIL